MDAELKRGAKDYFREHSREFMRRLSEKDWKAYYVKNLHGPEEAEANGLIKATWLKGNKLCNICYMNFVENQLRKAKWVKVSVEEVEASEVVAEPVANVAVGGVKVIDIEDIIKKEIEAKIKEGIELGDMETIMEEEVEAINDEEGMINLVGVIRAMSRIFYKREYVQKEGPIYSFDEMRELLTQTDSSLKDFFNQLYLLARPFERCEKTIRRMKKLMVFLCYLLASLNNSKINSFKFDLAYYLDSVGTSNEGLNTLANLRITTTARAVNRRKKQISEAHEEYIEKVLENRSENTFILNIDDYHNIHVTRQPNTTSTSWAAHMATIIANPCPTSAIPQNRALNPKVVDDELIMKHLNERFIVNLGISYYDRRQKYIDYTKALQIVYNQKPIQEYLSNNVVPIVADWPGQFFIRNAIAHLLLLNNEIISSCIFGQKKELGKKPQPWRIDLMLHIMHIAWLDISDLVYSKFGCTCKNIEFLYLTNLLSNLIPLVLEVYAVHHQEGNWLAYEEACMRCWSDLFLQFDRRNYKCAPLMFFSDVFYWMKENHPMFEMVTNNLSSLSDCPVELGDNAFQQYFVNSIKYPYSPKQLHTLYQKCATILLNTFKKIYRGHYLYSSIISSSDNINTYNLPPLGYEITDHNGKVLACGHGYHDYCLEKCNLKCLICLDYLRGEVSKNINALRVSMRKKLGENKFIEEDFGGVVEDDLDNSETAIDDAATIENLENAKKIFF
ncbi:hypothetical protein C2G38_2224849 [Gigaspora rosea]|uniref:Uncharacterized protein n=1 Tax=Gigaspora rosea TaxID=44941 RepID=A0A397TZS2_9GLOM|nr:hypothetical protein C2G38_2224849 [Gigaspora rosea]